MGLCTFCQTYDTESYFKTYCTDCANLRRMLILYDSKQCISILNRVLLRTEAQVQNKVNLELKGINTQIKK